MSARQTAISVSSDDEQDDPQQGGVTTTATSAGTVDSSQQPPKPPPRPPKRGSSTGAPDAGIAGSGQQTQTQTQASSQSTKSTNASSPNNNSKSKKEATTEEEKEHQQLIEQIKDIAKQLRASGQESAKLAKIKGNEEMFRRLDEVMIEIDEQSNKVLIAMKTSKSVLQDANLLYQAMVNINEYFQTVNKAHFFTSKHKLKLNMQNHYQTLRARLTQLLTAVSLELLTAKPHDDDDCLKKNPHIASELYTTGLHYFYGQAGKPMNYTFAFEKFSESAEYGDINAMIMLSKCYLNAWGCEDNEKVAWKWLERAVKDSDLSNSGGQAKTEYATWMIKSLKEKNKHVVKDFAAFLKDSKNGQHSGRILANADKQLHMLVGGGSGGNARNNTKRSQSAPQNDDDDVETEFDDNEEKEDDNRRGKGKDRGKSESKRGNGSKGRGNKTEEDDEDADNDALVALSYIEQDLQYALELLLQAASDGHIEAKTQLGLFYEECQENEQAAKWYSLASNQGCSKATVHLADLILYGKGGSFIGSKSKAFSLYTIAARSGHADAYNGLGLCYESGIGTDLNHDTAIHCYRLGAKQGSHKAMYNLGYLLVKNAMEVLENLEKVHGVNGNSKKGKSVFLSPESDGQPHQTILDSTYLVLYSSKDEELYQEMYRKVDKALREGVHWLRAAAENKIDDAAFQLGRLYEQGLGVPIDRDAALANYLYAAKAGHAKAACFAGNILYDRADLYDHSFDKLVSLYRQAAEGGVPQAMNSYGLLLEDGRASRSHQKDIYGAATWYYESCRYKYVKGFLNLAMLLASEPSLDCFYTLKGEKVTLLQAIRLLEDEFPTSTAGCDKHTAIRTQDMTEFQMLMETIISRVRGSSTNGNLITNGKDNQYLPYNTIESDRRISLQNVSFYGQGPPSQSRDNHPNYQNRQSLMMKKNMSDPNLLPEGSYELAPRLIGDHPEDAHQLLQPSPKPLLTYNTTRSANNSPDREHNHTHGNSKDRDRDFHQQANNPPTHGPASKNHRVAMPSSATLPPPPQHPSHVHHDHQHPSGKTEPRHYPLWKEHFKPHQTQLRQDPGPQRSDYQREDILESRRRK